VIDLGARILSNQAAVPILHNLFEQSEQAFDAWRVGGTELSFGSIGYDRGATGFLHALAPAEQAALERRRATALVETSVGQRSNFIVGLGVASDAILPDAIQQGRGPAYLWTRRDDHLSLIPTDWRAGAGAGFALSHRLSIGFAAAAGVERENYPALLNPIGRNAPQIRAMQARVALNLGRAATQIDMGTLTENGSFLGARGTGGFATGGSARTLFARWMSRIDLGAKSRLKMEYAVGVSDLAGPLNSFITGLKGLRSSAFRVSFERRGLFFARDRLAFAVAQPMRLDAGRATAVLPVDMNFKTERLLFATRSAPIASSGREIDFELAYERPLLDSLVVQANLVHQRSPGHVLGAPPATSALVRLTGRF